MNNDNPKVAILFVVFGLSVAAFTGALMKLLAEDISPYQITWFRFFGYVILLLPIVVVRIGKEAVRPARPGMQIVRGVTMAAATTAFVIGAQYIDFADAIAILYAYPFLLTALAVLFLGERVRAVGWIGVTGGFFGVLLVIRPEFRSINTGALFVFLCAFIVSIQMLLNRKLGTYSHPLVTSIWGAIVATLLLTLVVPFHWTQMNPDQFLVMCLMAVSGAVNQTCLVYGFSRAEASTLAPFTYFEIVAGVLCGLLMFGTLPSALSWGGIVLIIISGLIVARSLARERTDKAAFDVAKLKQS